MRRKLGAILKGSLSTFIGASMLADTSLYYDEFDFKIQGFLFLLLQARAAFMLIRQN